MTTTRTSSRSTASPAAPSVEACFDELSKIAEAQIVGKGSGRWWKNTALVGAGALGGTATGMIAETALRKAFGETWRSVPNDKKAMILVPLIGAAGVASYFAAQNLSRRRSEADRER